MHFQYFVDFDGTIAQSDVGHTFFTTFGADTATYFDVEKAWLEGEISSADLYRAACPHVHVSPEQLDAFLATQKIDPTFPRFVAYAGEHNESLLVLSDGFRNYIEPMLRAANLSELEVCANAFTFEKNGTISPDFPFEAYSCGKCANCKRHHVLTRREPATITVFIGDGKSDCCGAIVSDLIFAKKDLEKFCLRRQIDYFSFQNFDDVIRNLEIIRHRA